MKSVVCAICVLALSISSGAAVALGEVTGQVTRLVFHLDDWTDSTNYSQEALAHIYVAGLPPACGTGEGRVTLTKDNPQYKSIVATAMTAKASSMPVRVVYIGTCSIRSNSWDLSIIELN